MISRLLVLLVLALVGLGAVPPPGGVGAAERGATLQRTLVWLSGVQNADGGFGAPTSSAGMTAAITLAVASAGANPADVRHGGASLLDYLLASTPTFGAGVSGASQLVLAARATGHDPRAFGGRDLVATVRAGAGPAGQFTETLYGHGVAVLALAAAGEPVPATALDLIETRQAADGAWAWNGATAAGAGDSNTTAVLVQALVAGGRGDSPTLARALAFLATCRTSDGGFAYGPATADTKPDANSTALSIQALLATNQSSATSGWTGASAALASFQNASGAFRWQDDPTDDNLYATAQAVPALAELYLPFALTDATGTRARREAAQTRPGTPDRPDQRYFPETSHWVGGGFRQAWEARGGLAIFGLPLTEEFQELNPADGQRYTVQYFERARFEYHPEHAGTPYEVQLGLLGRQVTVDRTAGPFTPSDGQEATPGCRVFAEVKQAVCGAALQYWQANGGLSQFGLPISRPFAEGDRQVQYFERARFEVSGDQVALGLLGRELLYR